MLLSDRKKFIYFHIYKSGGSSVRRELMKYANKSHAIMQLVYHTLFIINNNINTPEIYKYHPSISKIKLIMGEEKFNYFYKFCFVREPLDWHVSQFFFVKRNKYHHMHSFVKDMCFEDFLKWKMENDVNLQSDMIYENDSLLVDDVFRFENIEQEFSVFCNRFNIQKKLRHINISERNESVELKKEVIDKFMETYRKDYELLNYGCPDFAEYGV